MHKGEMVGNHEKGDVRVVYAATHGACQDTLPLQF